MYDERAKQAVKSNLALFESVLEARQITRRGKDWRCPWHNDQHPSASLFIGNDGSALFTCHVCHLTLDVFGFVARFDGKPVGDVMRELMGDAGASQPAKPAAKPQAHIFPSLEALIKATAHFVECYRYPDAAGVRRMVTLRIEPPGRRKEFRFARPEQGGFVATAPAKPWLP